MRRRLVKQPDGDSTLAVHLAAMETKVFQAHPSLMAHLAVTRLEDQSTRTPGTLLLKTMGSTYVITAKEPDEALQLSVVGPTVDDALALLELLLAGETAPWEHDQWQKARNAKNKK